MDVKFATMIILVIFIIAIVVLYILYLTGTTPYGKNEVMNPMTLEWEPYQQGIKRDPENNCGNRCGGVIKSKALEEIYNVTR